jgi:hypothetical protein
MKTANYILLPFYFLIISCDQQSNQKGGNFMNEQEEQAVPSVENATSHQNCAK